MPVQPPARNRAAILLSLIALAPIWALGACSDGGGAYPSLASRPVERIADAASPAPAVPRPGPAVAPSTDLPARLADMVEQARKAKRGFDDKQMAAERLVAAAGPAPAGSEAWARAAQALSGLESARSLTAQPLADLDRLDIDDRLHEAQIGADGNPTPRADTAAIAQARETIAGLVALEDAVLVKLDGRLAH